MPVIEPSLGVGRQFEGIYMICEYTFSLESATCVPLRVQDSVVLDIDWPVRH
jgi:hypothetical protein